MTETAGVHLRWQQCHVTGVTDHRAFLDCSPASHVSASSLIPSQKSCSRRDGACSCLTQLNLQPSQSRAPTGLCRSAGTCLERTGQDPSWLRAQPSHCLGGWHEGPDAGLRWEGEPPTSRCHPSTPSAASHWFLEGARQSAPPFPDGGLPTHSVPTVHSLPGNSTCSLLSHMVSEGLLPGP